MVQTREHFAVKAEEASKCASEAESPPLRDFWLTMVTYYDNLARPPLLAGGFPIADSDLDDHPSWH